MRESKYRIATVISIVMIVLVLVLIVGTIIIMGNLQEKEYDFTSVKWQECKDEKRYQYIESLEKQYELVGMESDEIEDLLGEPSLKDKSGENIVVYEYRISDNALEGWKVYRISFEDDIVTNVEIVSEDW